MRFAKYHALGNAYLVVDAAEPPAVDLVRRLCDRHVGIGSDGVVQVRQTGSGEPADVRVFNPDGSEAQTSGNGVRIAARWLWDEGLAREQVAWVRTAARTYRCEVAGDGSSVRVAMGRASFRSSDLPMTGPARDVIDVPLALAGRLLRLSAVSMGNPHAVIHTRTPADAAIARWGPLLEHHPWFPERTNVQVVNVIDARNLRVAVWERGAGLTPTSGSSAAAAAAATRRLGLCDAHVSVAMPGGRLDVRVDDAFAVVVLGAVERVAAGTLAPEWLARSASTQGATARPSRTER